MRIAYLALGIFLLFLPGCSKGYRLSAERGTTVDLFASEHQNTPYGAEGSGAVLSLTGTDWGEIEGLEIGISGVRWSGPYTDNTLIGANAGYCLASDSGYFVRASIGPYYGDETVRTSTRWTFGINGAVGLQFNQGQSELYVGYWHFSNGSDLGLGQEPNMGEEFLNCGVSVLF